MNWLILLACVSSISCHTISTEIPPEKRWISQWITEWLRPTTSTSPPTVLPPQDPPKDCPPCQCGIARTRRRIVGGHETKRLEFPWMAVLLYGGRFYCGGSLINDLYVLTAAHCTAGFQASKITVRFLEHDRSMANETRTIDRKVEHIIRHVLYNPASYDSDIALLKLNERVDLSSALKRLRRRDESSGDNGNENGGDNGGDDGGDENGGNENEDDVGIRPVCLASPQLSYANYSSVVTGWGTTEEGGAVSNTLQEVYVPILTNDYCNSSTAYKRRITANMLCAGEMEGGRDACQGDSGGPLHVLNPDTAQFQEVGIVSWGEGCARPNRPGVYTRVNRYLTWIKCNTRDACYCP